MGVQIEDDGGLVEHHGLVSIGRLIGDDEEIVVGVFLIGVRRGTRALLGGARQGSTKMSVSGVALLRGSGGLGLKPARVSLHAARR